MHISFNWLKRHVNLDGVDLNDLVERFIVGVAEVESVEEVGRLDGVVIGRVLEVAPIEGARVRRTRVDLGQHGIQQIVCGAPNVAEGQWVAVATVGTTLGEGFTIAEREVRGLVSRGMICSEVEIGLGVESDGILVLDPQVYPNLTPGESFAQVANTRDLIFEIDNKSLTHRPDCWGHRGIAREIAALLDRPLLPLASIYDSVAFTDARPIHIEVDDPEGCPRYIGTCLDGITVTSSPLWLRLLLHRVGIRAISNVVDVTNFVMLDLGNPLHAFDQREIRGERIVVRPATDGESFTTLDGQVHRLDSRDLLIADGERGVALAGIMGGQNSEIRDDTTAILLEAANFHPTRVRTTSQRLGLRTDSSARFEKSLDPALPADAVQAFCSLLSQLDPAVTVRSAMMDIAAPAADPIVISLRVPLVQRRLGKEVSQEEITKILQRLEFTVHTGQGDTLTVTVPSFRATKDVSIEADLIEEVGRAVGYNNITPQGPSIALDRPDRNHRKRFERATRAYLSYAAGMDEVMTYSFDSDPFLTRIGAMPAEASDRLQLKNPISAEMPALRTGLGPNLLNVLEKNTRTEDDIRVYEMGRVFHPAHPPGPGNLPAQPVTLGALVSLDQPDNSASAFFALKHVLCELAIALERPELQPAPLPVAHPWAHPVRQATLLLNGDAVGYLAEVHPRTLKTLGVSRRAALFELNLDAWRNAAERSRTYTPLARFPSVYRDYAVVVDQGVPAAQVASTIAAVSPEWIREVAFQSVYTGAGMEDGKKSLAWSVTLRLDDRTLTEPEIRTVEEQIWAALAKNVGGVPRA